MSSTASGAAPWAATKAARSAATSGWIRASIRERRPGSARVISRSRGRSIASPATACGATSASAAAPPPPGA